MSENWAVSFKIAMITVEKCFCLWKKYNEWAALWSRTEKIVIDTVRLHLFVPVMVRWLDVSSCRAPVVANHRRVGHCAAAVTKKETENTDESLIMGTTSTETKNITRGKANERSQSERRKEEKWRRYEKRGRTLRRVAHLKERDITFDACRFHSILHELDDCSLFSASEAFRILNSPSQILNIPFWVQCLPYDGKKN